MIDLLNQGMSDESPTVRAAVQWSVSRVDGLPEDYIMNVIEQGLQDEATSVVEEIVNACIDRKDISSKTIRDIVNGCLKSNNRDIRRTTLKTCCDHSWELGYDCEQDLLEYLIERGIHDEDEEVRKTSRECAVNFCEYATVLGNYLLEWMFDVCPELRKAATWAIRNAEVSMSDEPDPETLIELALRHYDESVRNTAIEVCRFPYFELNGKILDRWIKDSDPFIRSAVVAYISNCRFEYARPYLETALKDHAECVRQAAIDVCSEKDIPICVIDEWASDENSAMMRLAAVKIIKPGTKFTSIYISSALLDDDDQVRLEAIRRCRLIDVPITAINRGLLDYNTEVRIEAVKACEGREVPLYFIELGISDDSPRVRRATIEICRNKSIPREIIECCLDDEYYFVRKMAEEILSDYANSSNVAMTN